MPDQREAQETRRRAWSKPHVRLTIQFALLLLGAELTRTLTFPWRTAGVVFAAAAVVQGVRALLAGRLARRAEPDVPAGTGPVLLAVGVAAASMLLVWHVVLIALTPVVTDQERCQGRALTRTAEQLCTDRLEQRVLDLTGLSG